jgi:CDP-diacylglycerol--serine O-phosphatidyltransferase
MKKHIPNFLTICNLLLGWMSVYFAFNNLIKYAIFSIIIASVFDYLDGFSARWLKVSSNLGAQLDSLADFITFGIAPAIIIYNLSITIPFLESLFTEGFLYLIIGLIPVFAAIRLARFNSVQQETTYFNGLPSPGFALLAISLSIIFIENGYEFLKKIFPFIAITFASLMVVNVKFIAFKINDFQFKNNKILFTLIVISIVSSIILILLGYYVLILPIVLFLYLIFSIIYNFIS